VRYIFRKATSFQTLSSTSGYAASGPASSRGFRVEIGDPGVEVVRPHRVTQGFPVGRQGRPVLVVVGAVLHLVPESHEAAAELQPTPVARRAVELNQAHVVGGADGRFGVLRRDRRENAVQVGRGLLRHVQKLPGAEGAEMHATGGHQVAQVVDLEVELVRQGQRGGRIGPPLDGAFRENVAAGLLDRAITETASSTKRLSSASGCRAREKQAASSHL
jgi:hypothetical protein